MGREIFEESGRSLVRGTLDYLQGLKMLRVKRIERALPIGTSLTVVGEAVKDDIGTILIQRPHKGAIYVSPKVLINSLQILGYGQGCFLKCGTEVLQVRLYGVHRVVGVFLIAKHTIRYIMERRRRYDCSEGSTMLLCYPSEKHVMRSCSFRVLAAAAQRLEQDHDGLDEKTDNGPESAKKERLMPDLCVICLEHEYNAVFVP
ncbi:hypothetical protein IFM89_020103 [Coptis chinensis]|uniref:RING-type E3 ubiquitin transferase n=1 Tax=Coptis chinensis TaxID=261450 RepID=A0A835LN79_9MAGN|nr:hypothetical protein IFM89_020103 [Coptis chinensis]